MFTLKRLEQKKHHYFTGNSLLIMMQFGKNKMDHLYLPMEKNLKLLTLNKKKLSSLLRKMKKNRKIFQEQEKDKVNIESNY